MIDRQTMEMLMPMIMQRLGGGMQPPTMPPMAPQQQNPMMLAQQRSLGSFQGTTGEPEMSDEEINRRFQMINDQSVAPKKKDLPPHLRGRTDIEYSVDVNGAPIYKKKGVNQWYYVNPKGR